MEEAEEEKIKTLVDQLKKFKPEDQLLFITGAGISAESGLPTYRGINGLYQDKEIDEGYQIEEILSASVFSQQPELTWKYLHLLAQSSKDKQPNLGHKVIKKLENFFFITVFTQNVDMFHQRVGSNHIIPIHGTLQSIICTYCDYGFTTQDYSQLASLPRCPKCKNVLRPDIVLFEENLDVQKVTHLEKVLTHPQLKVVFSVGTTSSFPYIVYPIQYAMSHNILSVEINPEKTSISSYVNYKINSSAVEALGKIWKWLNYKAIN